MDNANVYALDAAKEITIARMTNVSIAANKVGGENVAEFYETVYRKILELAKESES